MKLLLAFRGSLRVQIWRTTRRMTGPTSRRRRCRIWSRTAEPSCTEGDMFSDWFVCDRFIGIHSICCVVWCFSRQENGLEDSFAFGGVQSSIVPAAPIASASVAGATQLFASMTAPAPSSANAVVLPPPGFATKPTISNGLAKPSFSNADELREKIARQMAMNFQLMVQMLLMVMRQCVFRVFCGSVLID